MPDLRRGCTAVCTVESGDVDRLYFLCSFNFADSRILAGIA